MSNQLLATPYGDAVVVPIHFFSEHFLPPLPSHLNLPDVYSALQGDGSASRRAITSKGRWRGFPTASRRSKNAFFRNMKAIVEAITNAGAPATTLRFRCNRGKNQAQRSEESLPDGYLSFQSNTSTRDSWLDVAVSCEYRTKTSMKNGQDVSIQLLLILHLLILKSTQTIERIAEDMRNCLFRDVRRRFTFAFTVEDTQMRFWYCDRSVLVVTESFEFATVSSESPC